MPQKPFKKLKKRWGVTSNGQLTLILLVFTLTGFSVLYFKKHVHIALGVDANTHFLLKALIFILLILPVYMLFLYMWGILLGQRKFFHRFFKLKWRKVNDVFGRGE